MLGVVEGVSSHYHEHQDVILGWAWKRFCTSWSRTIEYAGRERKRDEEREAKAQDEMEWSALRQAHDARNGSG